MDKSSRIIPTAVIIFLVALVGIGITVFSAETYTARSDFCGTSCHIMKGAYVSWQNSAHGKENIDCVECHYAPGEKFTLTAKFKGLGQLFTYLSSNEKEVRKRPHVDDRSCLQSDCHIREKFQEKTIKFAEKVTFVHKTHDEKNIDGQDLHCSTCHRHNPFIQTARTEMKHMEVAQESCFLCHFKNAPFAEERAKCSICHQIPDDPIIKLAALDKSAVHQVSSNSEDEDSLNHEDLEKKQVPCESCHLQIVRGTGSVTLGKCLNCHENHPEITEDWDHARTAHKDHVAAQTADCFNCHETIAHKNENEKFNHIDAALADCRECHAEPHLFQRQLLAGTGGHGIDEQYPIKHFDVNLNCTGCHNQETHNEKGISIKIAEAQVCVDCHTEKERTIVDKWKSDINDFFTEARELEAEASEAIQTSTGKVSDSTREDAIAMLKMGQENLKIVNAGGGVHNKKFSVYLIDVAIEKFEDAIDMIQ